MSSHVPGAIVPGTIIGGKYKIEREIASGGQGTVFEATHIRLRQRVAIKFLHVHRAQNGQRAERLFREARAAFRMRSEHVARVIDVDMIDDAPFIVMEYLRGVDLKMLIESRGALPCHEAVGLVLQACDGVAEAHELGIVHRDLKPSNLFLEDRPEGAPIVKVLDFGLSKSLAPGSTQPEDLDLTEPLVLLGSPRYMSPEQARDPRQADERSDIWSLGLILHELLTGLPAFRARTKADVLALVLLKNPTPVSLLRPDIPPEIERVILRCLQKAPEHRFNTVRQLMTELVPFAAVPGSAGPPSTNAGQRRRAPRPLRFSFAAAALAAAVLAGWGVHRRGVRSAFAPDAGRATVAALPPPVVAWPKETSPPSASPPAPSAPSVSPTATPTQATPTAAVPFLASRTTVSRHHEHRRPHAKSAALETLEIRHTEPDEIDDPLDGRK
ncbi:MAG TPA: serine/threonine-protein kinase [Polyangia bacterium]|nr:serine/threonine-protein kinase [Polyangia bacterium]